MSILLATVQAVAPVVHSAAAAAPAAAPAPQVVTHTVTVTKTVPAVSEPVYRAVEFGLLVLSGVVASALHQLLFSGRDKLSESANRVIWFVYCALLGAIASWLSGQLALNWDSVLTYLENLVAVAGASSLRFNWNQVLTSVGSGSSSSSAPSSDSEVIPQATTPPAQAGF